MKRILFLNFYAFSLTGGIEKFNRAFLKALSDFTKEGTITADACSAFDNNVDTRYFQKENYKTFAGKKLRFALHILLNAFRYDTIILSHIHLSPIAWLVKTIFPSKEIILVAHGVEVWGKQSAAQKKILQKADKILAVSAFTKQKLVEVHGIDQNKIIVFHNTIDPYFICPAGFSKPGYLLERYGLRPEDEVVFTLTRLAGTEKNKGYDGIIRTISKLKRTFPAIKYILSGKYDQGEKNRLDDLNERNNVTGEVILTGFVHDEEVADHYLLADVFILPSRKEGFGIVFIEAMACGLPVVAGNKDGSVDALKNGELGTLVDPGNEAEILQALKNCLSGNGKQKGAQARKELQQKVYETFGFDTFKEYLTYKKLPGQWHPWVF